MKLTYRRTGFIASGLLHVLVVSTLLLHVNNSNGLQQADTTLPLSLSMFEEARPEPVAAEPVPVRQPEVASKPRPEPEQEPVPVTTRVAVKEQEQPVISQPQEIVAQKDTPTAASPAAEPVITAQSPRLTTQQESLKQRYIRKLLRRIHRKKHYPRGARRRREEGEVLVGFIVSSNGEISNIRLVRSSGYASLDRAAMKTITRLGSVSPIPGELAMTDWSLAVPIAYHLRR